LCYYSRNLGMALTPLQAFKVKDTN
jgi:hypothetical protein